MGCQKIIIIIFHLSSHPHQGNDIWITSWEILITSCDIWITSCGVQFTGLVTVHTIFDTHTHARQTPSPLCHHAKRDKMVEKEGGGREERGGGGVVEMLVNSRRRSCME